MGVSARTELPNSPPTFVMPLYRQTIALYEKLFAIYQTYSIMSNTSYLAKTVSAL